MKSVGIHRHVKHDRVQHARSKASLNCKLLKSKFLQAFKERVIVYREGHGNNEYLRSEEAFLAHRQDTWRQVWL